MEILLKSGHPVRLDLIIAESNNQNFIAVTFDDGFQSVMQNALPILHKMNIPATIFVPTGCLGKKPEWIKDSTHAYSNEIVMTEEQLQSISSGLIDIESHTVTHTHLDNIEEATIKSELNESKTYLETILKKKVKFLSVPYATFNEGFTHLFKQAGYERVFLNIPTFPATKTDLYVMGRIKCGMSDWLIETRLKFWGAYQWLPLAIDIKDKLIRGHKGL